MATPLLPASPTASAAQSAQLVQEVLGVRPLAFNDGFLLTWGLGSVSMQKEAGYF